MLPTIMLLCQDPDSPSYWMDMLKTMSETLRIGMVVSDMFVPGCPLAYLNEGFAAQTGTCEPNSAINVVPGTCFNYPAGIYAPSYPFEMITICLDLLE